MIELSDLSVGAEVSPLRRTPDAVDLFMFSAAAWLIHRIHYDLPFTTDHDGHPGLLIHGPLQGTYMIQAAQNWLGPAARLCSIEYRHVKPAHLGDSLESGGRVSAIEDNVVRLELWVRRSDGDITTEGKAEFVVEETR